ncbi:hypothetical protein [Chondromyces crocatus]|uniref:Peroxidase n=1 Tax=Chondromyces crocatus TaxID=52 RepID=A0A0K1ET21_CHOCO|nr:hypothetical protein [Chondromyces crocatus]AKT44016.1 uncharacterized protein CMC5_082540 [Chondromyces crocatus]
MATQVLRDPRRLVLSARWQALAELATQLAEAPWSVDDARFAGVMAAGLSVGEIAHAVAIVGMFSHFTRAADATGIAPDYASPLPRLEVDENRVPAPRPALDGRPARAARAPLARVLPDIAAAFSRWREQVFVAAGALTEGDRAVLAQAVARALGDAVPGDAVPGDAASVGALGGSPSHREVALAAFAEKLTVAPWRMREADLEVLRGLGLDDRAILHAIAVVGFQNQDSRVRLALG